MHTGPDAPDTPVPGTAAARTERAVSADVLFAGPGEMRARCRAFDWAATGLGSVDAWPSSLRTTAATVLATGFPAIVLWGPDLVQLYNDAYIPLLGVKHPGGLGVPTRVCWPEAWDFNAPIYARVFDGETVTPADQLYQLARRGPEAPLDDVYLTLSYVPVLGEAGGVAGVLVTIFDMTAQVQARAVEADRARLLTALKMEQTRLAQVFRQSPSFLAVLRGPDNVFDFVNAAYEQIIGHGRDVVGRPLFEALPETRGQGFDDYLGRVRATGEPLVFRDLPVLLDRTPGAPREERFIDITYLPLVEADGSHDAVIAHGTDVTEQVRARREVERLLAASEEARAEAEAANQQLQEQAAELEAASEELQATAAELEEQAAAAEAARVEADLERRRLAATLEQLPVGVHIAEAPGGRLVMGNAAVRRIWGGAPASAGVADYSADYVGYHCAGPRAGQAYASHEWPLARALAGGEVVEGEVVEVARPDGSGGVSRVLVSLSAAPVRDADGAVVGGVVTSADVTERERLLAAERVAAGRARLLQALTAAFSAELTPEAVVRVLLEHGVPALGATTGILMLRSADGTALVSAGAHGYPAGVLDQIARLPLDAALPIAAAVRENRSVWVENPEVGVRTYPGLGSVYAATGNHATAALPLADAAGRVIGALAFNYAAPRTFDPEARAFKEAVARQCAQALEHARLFAAERAARAEAEVARRAAEGANEAKSSFLANMSHELRTPLNAIGGYTQLLELGLHGPVTEAQRAALARVQGAQRRLLALINDVLNYAKLEGGRVEYDVRPVDVRDVVAEVVPLVEPQMAAKGLAFAVRLPDGPCVAWADREKLGQVLLNLLSNAAKFTDAGRVTVDVAVRDTGPGPQGGPQGPDAGRPDAVFLRVRDTGRGIPRAKQEAIFEPFVQVRTGYAQATEGTGLGLAISRDLSRGMGGDLRVRSAPGEGATFTVALRRERPV